MSALRTTGAFLTPLQAKTHDFEPKGGRLKAYWL